MRDPIQRYFRVGVVSAMMYAPLLKEGPSAWSKLIRAIARDDYFDVVEINPLPNDEVRAEVSALVAQSHMKLVQNAHGRLLGAGLNPNDVNEEGRQAAEAALLAGVDEAAAMGSTTMGMPCTSTDTSSAATAPMAMPELLESRSVREKPRSSPRQVN